MGKYTLVLTGIVLTVGLNICYFNSEGKIVRTADKYSLEHKYCTPNAPWLWTAAVLKDRCWI